MAPVDNRLLSALASSLQSFVGGGVVFKALPPEPGEGADARLSADPLEVADALGCGDADGGVVAEAVREAMDGLWQARFGRSEQARLAMLADVVLSEALALRSAGLTPWVLSLALRHCVELAESALSRLASEHLAKEALTGVNLLTQTDATDTVGLSVSADKQASAAFPNGFPNIVGDSSDDDISWFFGEVAPTLDNCLASAPAPVPFVETQSESIIHLTESPNERDATASIRKVCSELLRQGAQFGCGKDVLDDKHLFVYASRRLSMRTTCSLVPGIVCHVPSAHLIAGVARLSEFPPLSRCIFVDASLTREAYASYAPSERRIQQEFVLGVGDDAALCALDSLSERIESKLGEAVRCLVRSREIGCIFLAGDASAHVSSVCRSEGVLLVTGLPVRLLFALAEEGGADVVSGLPSYLVPDEPVAPWETSVPLRIELRELSEATRRTCFSYPLSGHRQPLLPHQLGVGERASGTCWELRASAVRDAGTNRTDRAQTVLLEASCDASLRHLHAELTDALFRASHDNALGVTPQRLPGSGAWAFAIATSLENCTLQDNLDLVAPWLLQGASVNLSVAAALERFAVAFRRIGEREEKCAADVVIDADLRDFEHDAESQHQTHSANCESLSALLAVVSRTARVVELLVNLDVASE